jgi:hypothetical protein
MPVEPGDLVAAASAERTAALVGKLERAGVGPGAGAAEGTAAGIAAGIDEEDVVTLDTWIRVADSFTLHDDAPEAQARAELGRELRAVRELIAPAAGRLTDDPRDV